VMGCPILCICLMHFTSVASSTLSNTPNFFLRLINVTPYKWYLKEVIGTPLESCCKHNFWSTFNSQHCVM
jgi:hypothetical protein